MIQGGVDMTRSDLFHMRRRFHQGLIYFIHVFKDMNKVISLKSVIGLCL